MAQLLLYTGADGGENDEKTELKLLGVDVTTRALSDTEVRAATTTLQVPPPRLRVCAALFILTPSG